MNNINSRILEITDRLRWMCENLEGCDWCCGGGHDEWNELSEELAQILGCDRTELDESGLI